jgi:hypothetical protein
LGVAVNTITRQPHEEAKYLAVFAAFTTPLKPIGGKKYDMMSTVFCIDFYSFYIGKLLSNKSKW